MLWPVSVFDLMFKGVLVGIFASAPMGPVGVLCIQRTLNKGRWFGFVTGLGAALSDIIYALVTGYGMSFIADFIENETNRFYLQLIGSVLLLGFGIFAYRSKPSKDVHKASKQRGTLFSNFVQGFFITFSNPLIIFLFVALFARFAFVAPEHCDNESMKYIALSVGYLSVVGGAVLWWFVLTFFVDKLRVKFDTQRICIINKVIGCVIILAAIVGFGFTITGIYSLH